jgi:ATP-dependent DNA helicase RecG
MVATNDGFEIAEVDLQLRGPGDIMGTQQSGVLDLKIADLSKDGQLVILARDEARQLLQQDEDLQLPQHSIVRIVLQEILKSRPNWGKIA